MPQPTKKAKKTGGGKRPARLINGSAQKRYSAVQSKQTVYVKNRQPRGFTPGAKVGISGREGGRVNPYLQTLIDPERYPGIRYPDGFARETAMVQLINEKNIPYLPGDLNATIDEAGSFYIVSRPSLNHPLWMYKFENVGDSPSWVLTEQTERFGIYPISGSALNSPTQDGQMFLQKAVQQNLKMPLVFENKDYVSDPFKVTDATGNVRYGYTMGGGTGAYTLNASVCVGGITTVGDTLELTVSNGVAADVVITSAAMAANQTVVQLSGNIASLLYASTATGSAAPPAGTLCAGRVAPISFRLKYITATGTTSGLIVLGINMKCSIGTGNGWHLGLIPYDFPDAAQFLAKWTRYRPVSSSLWVAYEGSTLNDGGQLACVMYQGGEHPNTAGIYNYATVSQVPEGYEDKMKTGSYQYWLPSNVADVAMRRPINPDEWTHSYCVVTGNVGTTTQINAIRARLVSNMEFQSPSQIWSYGSVQPSQSMIDHAAAVLFLAPTSMSNDSHLSTIYNWLKNKVSSGFEFVRDNAAWIVPLAGTAAAML